MSAPELTPADGTTVRERCVQAGFAVLCAYEATAIATGRAPTVSMLCRRRRWIEAGLLVLLVLHLHPLVTGRHIGDSRVSSSTPVTAQ